jgi:hypothetical protein
MQDESSAFFLDRKGSNKPVSVSFELLNEFAEFHCKNIQSII